MRTIVQTVLLFLVLAVSTVHAVPNENITLYGLGINSCGSFLESTKERSTAIVERATGHTFYSERSVYSEWISGYVTAYNVMNFDKPNAKMINSDNDGLMAWVTSYCQKNPLHVMERAVNALVRSHITER